MPLHFDNLRHARAFRIGRATYHAKMQRQADERRRRLVALVSSGRFEPKSSQALADELGVDRMTVWRDLQRLELKAGRCPHCGQLLPEVVDSAALEPGRTNRRPTGGK